MIKKEYDAKKEVSEFLDKFMKLADEKDGEEWYELMTDFVIAMAGGIGRLVPFVTQGDQELIHEMHNVVFKEYFRSTAAGERAINQMISDSGEGQNAAN